MTLISYFRRRRASRQHAEASSLAGSLVDAVDRAGWVATLHLLRAIAVNAGYHRLARQLDRAMVDFEADERDIPETTGAYDLLWRLGRRRALRVVDGGQR